MKQPPEQVLLVLPWPVQMPRPDGSAPRYRRATGCHALTWFSGGAEGSGDGGETKDVLVKRLAFRDPIDEDITRLHSQMVWPGLDMVATDRVPAQAVRILDGKHGEVRRL